MNFFKKKTKRIRVVLWSYGDEGKTNLLYKGFKGIKNYKSIPTIGFNVEEIEFNEVNITFWDIGTSYIKNKLRNNYLPYNDAVIFLIDSSKSLLQIDDYNDFKNNYEELQKCIKIIEDIPLLIAITKIDKRKTSTLEIIDACKLSDLFQRKKKFGIIECSSFTLEGIKEIKYWLSSIVSE